MKQVKVELRPVAGRLNLPTVIKTAIAPGDNTERLYIATQVGEIYSIGNGEISSFLDIRDRIIELGTASGGYDERGLLGLAFHPEFQFNGLFYLHYSLAGTQGPGALTGAFRPDPCDPGTLNLQWTDRENRYDHIDTVEEWGLQADGRPGLRRTLLKLRRPFANHNGVNSLKFSPETGRLVLTTGDGGAGYDPFHLSQNNMELAGKIIELDVSLDAFASDPPAVTRFSELPMPLPEALTVIAKGVRNIPGISYEWYQDRYIKYVGIVGQSLVEAVYAFAFYNPIPVTRILEASEANPIPEQEWINFGWPGWEGSFPTSVLQSCPGQGSPEELITAYYENALQTSTLRLPPLTCYYHRDSRPDTFEGTALTGVQAYLGDSISELKGSVVFTDFVRKGGPPASPARGVLAYTYLRPDCMLQDYGLLDAAYDFAGQSAFFTSLGTNLDQTSLYLGVYGSMHVTDFNLGTVFEILPDRS